MASGRPAFGSRFNTGNMESALLARGFHYGTAPNSVVIGWNGGHAAVTLPDGTPVSSGESGAGVRVGGGGAYQPQFTNHMYLPVEAQLMDTEPDPAAVPAPESDPAAIPALEIPLDPGTEPAPAPPAEAPADPVAPAEAPADPVAPPPPAEAVPAPAPPADPAPAPPADPAPAPPADAPAPVEAAAPMPGDEPVAPVLPV